MKRLNYIELKRSAMAKRGKRREWLDKKIAEYTLERETVLAELSRDTTAIEELEVLESKEKLIEAKVDELTNTLFESTGDEAKEAMEKLNETKASLDVVREQLRSVYYDR